MGPIDSIYSQCQPRLVNRTSNHNGGIPAYVPGVVYKYQGAVHRSQLGQGGDTIRIRMVINLYNFISVTFRVKCRT